MRLKRLQITAALLAAVAFVLATVFAGVLLVSFAFAAVGASLLAFIVYGLARHLLEHSRYPALRPPSR